MTNYIKIFFLFFFLIQSVVFTEITTLNEKTLSKSIKNFYKASDGIYRSSQPNKDNMKLLEMAGMKSVINLRRYHSDDYEAKNTSLELYRVKMNPGKINDEEVIEALRIIKNSEKPILIHCWHGSDRTGLIVVMYRLVFENSTKEEALKELREKKYGYHESFYGNIVKYIENVDVENLKNKI